MILHVTTLDRWNADSDDADYTPSTLAVEGFIHACSPDQLVGVLGRHFGGHRALLVLVIDELLLVNKIVREEGLPGQLFPHIYGSINRNAVIQQVPIEANATGTFDIPEILPSRGLP